MIRPFRQVFESYRPSSYEQSFLDNLPAVSAMDTKARSLFFFFASLHMRKTE